MKKFVEKEQVLEILSSKNAAWDGYIRVKELPDADVRPVVHGEWEHKVTSSYAGGGATFCSVCGYGYSDGAFFEVEDFDYCPHCGATMKVDREDVELPL